MLEIELDNFIFKSEANIDYFDFLVKYIQDNEKKILDFFNIKKLPNKCNILMLNYDSFRDYQEKTYGKVYDYVRGITDPITKTIRVLNIDDQIKYTTHKDTNVEDTAKLIVHEIVHICNDYINNDFGQITWFKEGLATNLASQKYSLINLTDCDFELLKNNFNKCKDNYAYSYTIVNYILNHYSKEEVDKLVSDSEYLITYSDKLFNEAKDIYAKRRI